MKRANRKQTNAKQKKASPGNEWASLTWDDLDGWAGSRSVQRGRAYQRDGRVRNLAITDDGRLLATVEGGERYIVSVSMHIGKKGCNRIESHCTCPVGYNCKHAVATVAEYLQTLTDGATAAKADKDDPRWRKLSSVDAEYEDELDDGDEDEEDDVDDDPEDRRARSSKRSPSRPVSRTRREWDEKIKQHICGKSREELIEQVLSFVDRFPELREEYRERVALGEGDVERLAAQAKREMRERTSEIGWHNHWDGEGHTPDYDRLKHRLERLVELGHSDAVVELGREFIERATAQVEQSHDEGETATAAAECFPVIFDAVAKSKLTGPQKILFAIDACLNDDYDMLDDSVEPILDAQWKPADWSEVANDLARRISKIGTTTGNSCERNFHRDCLSGWLAEALENAGRGGELLAVFESEARTTGSYERLVRHLIAEKRFEDAERWAREGIETTREKLPGIASSLAGLLCEIARGNRQWDIVAAHAACEFFDRPGKTTFDNLVSLAKKAKCGEQVEAAALRFLETDEQPFKWMASPKAGQMLRIDSAWPLPMPDYLVPLMRPSGRSFARRAPHYDVLLDMAIAAKRPDDVLHWYNKMPKGQRHLIGSWDWSGDAAADRVAEAVAKSHPERALEIYQTGLAQALPHANLSAYELAASYLKKMRPIMKSLGREADWKKALLEIRSKYGNRPRFMEVLDKLDGRTIVQTQKARRR